MNLQVHKPVRDNSLNSSWKRSIDEAKQRGPTSRKAPSLAQRFTRLATQPHPVILRWWRQHLVDDLSRVPEPTQLEVTKSLALQTGSEEQENLLDQQRKQ